MDNLGVVRLGIPMHGTEDQPSDEPEERRIEDAHDGWGHSLRDKDEAHRATASEDQQCSDEQVRKEGQLQYVLGV